VAVSLSYLDIGIIIGYIALTIWLGFWISTRASKSLKSYFLAGQKLPWYILGLSNASGMFDVAGTMWLVYLVAVYGLKSVFIPWLWPVFNQIFLMMFLAVWLRRSGALTGAEWITFRFGNGVGARASHLSIVVFALITVIGYLAYGFLGIGILTAEFIPFKFAADAQTNFKIYAVIVVALTTLYVVKGGMYSVVLTEVVQFIVKGVAGIAVAIIAMHLVTPAMLAKVVPAGWQDIWPHWNLNLDWMSVARTAPPQDRIVATEAAYKIGQDGYSLFMIFLMLLLFKGVFQSLAGPAPNYDMQRLLSARSPKEASLISGFVNIVLFVPRYLLITGLAILALVYIGPEWTAQKAAAQAAGKVFHADFETILSFALHHFIPTGLLGLTIAGLLSAFMATYSASLNAAPVYLVNDVYKKYIAPDKPPHHYVTLSQLVSLLFAIVGTCIGLFLTSINEITVWITTGLYGGYTAANVIKWYWWRMNGFGFFAGMVCGIVAALLLGLPPHALKSLLAGVSGASSFVDDPLMALKAFPFIFAICVAASIIGSYLAPPTEMSVLKEFYRKTRPWGFWGPVYAALKAEDPSVQPNRDFWIDMFNVVIGIVWQTSLIAAAIFLVIQNFERLSVALGVVAVTSIILKFTWLDRLSDEPRDVLAAALAPAPTRSSA
jgi:solute:Na+ symporter, SSS family